MHWRAAHWYALFGVISVHFFLEGNVNTVLCDTKLIYFILRINTYPLCVWEVWRLRKYTTEKCIAAAKPLWFMPSELRLAKGMAKRIV